MANNLLMLGLSYFRHKLFEFQAFHNQAHIINFTGIIIYFCGTYYLYAPRKLGKKRFVPKQILVFWPFLMLWVANISFGQNKWDLRSNILYPYVHANWECHLLVFFLSGELWWGALRTYSGALNIWYNICAANVTWFATCLGGWFIFA